MLGINSPREPITAEFSREIRQSLWRATTGHLKKKEKEAIKKGAEALNEWEGEWKTD